MEALRIGVLAFLLNTPYYLLCCVPFLPMLRVKRSLLVGMIALTGVGMAVYYALRETVLPGLASYQALVMLGFYAAYFVQYKLYFSVPAPKLLYIFLVAQAYSIVLNVTAKFIDVQIFPAHISTVAATSYSLIVLGLMALTYPVLYRFFSGRLRRAFAELPARSFWQLCITPVLFFIINQVYASLVYQKMSAVDPSLGLHNFIIFLMILVTGLVTYLVTLTTAMDAARRVRLEAEVKGMEQQLTLQARSYEQLTRNIEASRAARHDLRHHLAAMAAYVEHDDKEGLRAYLTDYRESLGDGAEPPVCGNYAVDVVVRHYLALARSAGAALDVKLDLPQNAGVPDSDLCIVFGNLFENAALAVARQAAGPRFLTARCMVENSHIVLTVDNSTDPEVMLPKKALRRGVGQTSVAAVAEKYGGGTEFVLEGHIYRASVLLNIPIEEGGK